MEKTFEELVENHTFYDRSDYAKKEPLLDKADVLQLLQQVREATIAECSQIIEDILGNTFDEIEEMKTDRIKLTE